jgi:hypothetical protein
MSSAEALTALKAELSQALVPQVLDVLARALREGTAVHRVEADLWDLALQLGRRSLAAFFAACGSGDLGETLTLPDDQQLPRLDDLHARRYVSFFGAFRLERAGMHWTPAGAQAMLDLRSVWIAGQSEAFQQNRIERDRELLHPHRDLVAGEAFFALAP